MGFVFALRTSIIGPVARDGDGLRRTCGNDLVAAVGAVASRAGLDVMLQEVGVAARHKTKGESGVIAVGRRDGHVCRWQGPRGVDGDGAPRRDERGFVAGMVFQLQAGVVSGGIA